MSTNAASVKSPIKPKIAIVGAGPAGLATARALRSAGLDFTVFERNKRVGGIWDIEAPGTPMYRSAHFISSAGRWTSHFAGSPFPDGTPAYPSHRQVQEYLEKFADDEGLSRFIEFNTSVDSAAQQGDGRWMLVERDVPLGMFDALIVCSGTLWSPTIPDWPGTFDSTIRHSNTYSDPSELAGKRVLIVGGGNSAVDIACDAARSADKTFLSLRRGYWFLPKFIMGIPTDAFFREKETMPGWMSPPNLAAFLGAVAGNPSRYGLPEPDHAPLQSHPVMNSEVLHHVGHGRIQPLSDIAELRGDRVFFEDGREEVVDEIICATGYRADAPFLPIGTLSHNGGTRPDLLMTAFHPSNDRLYFNGMIETDGGVFGLFDRLGSIIADVIQARRDTADPGDRAALTKLIAEANALTATTGKIDTARHRGYVDSARLIEAFRLMEAAGYGRPLGDVARSA